MPSELLPVLGSLRSVLASGGSVSHFVVWESSQDVDFFQGHRQQPYGHLGLVPVLGYKISLGFLAMGGVVEAALEKGVWTYFFWLCLSPVTVSKPLTKL